MADPQSPAVNCALQQSVILEVIFSFLSAFELGNVCAVSRKWREEIQKVLKRRRGKVVFEYFENADQADVIANVVKGRLSALPRYCLAFLCHNTSRSLNWPHCRPLGLPTPKECEVYGVVGKGCIGTTSAGKVVEDENGNGMACLFLPHGLGNLCLTPVFSESDMGQLLMMQQPVRLLVLVNRRVEEYCEIVFRLVEAFPDVVVAGGYTKEGTSYSHFTCRTENDTSTSLVGFAVSGSSVRVASVILDRHIKDREKIQDLFKQLRDSGIVDNNRRHDCAFALVFSCYLRGSSQYDGERNVEAEEFMRVFPGVPLIGSFGRGEIGHVHLPTLSLAGEVKCADSSESARNVSKLSPPSKDYLDNITRGYSSVYVLVSVVEPCAS